MADWRKTKCCGTCRHWDIDHARNNAGAVRGDVPCRCDVPLALPASWPSYASRALGYTFREDGAGCVLHEPRPKE